MNQPTFSHVTDGASGKPLDPERGKMSSKAVQEVDRMLSFPYSEVTVEEMAVNSWERKRIETPISGAQVPPGTHDIYQPLSLSSYHTDTASCSSTETVFTLGSMCTQCSGHSSEQIKTPYPHRADI